MTSVKSDATMEADTKKAVMLSGPKSDVTSSSSGVESPEVVVAKPDLQDGARKRKHENGQKKKHKSTGSDKDESGAEEEEDKKKKSKKNKKHRKSKGSDDESETDAGDSKSKGKKDKETKSSSSKEDKEDDVKTKESSTTAPASVKKEAAAPKEESKKDKKKDKKSKPAAAAAAPASDGEEDEDETEVAASAGVDHVPYASCLKEGHEMADDVKGAPGAKKLPDPLVYSSVELNINPAFLQGHLKGVRLRVSISGSSTKTTKLGFELARKDAKVNLTNIYVKLFMQANNITSDTDKHSPFGLELDYYALAGDDVLEDKAYESIRDKASAWADKVLKAACINGTMIPDGAKRTSIKDIFEFSPLSDLSVQDAEPKDVKDAKEEDDKKSKKPKKKFTRRADQIMATDPGRLFYYRPDKIWTMAQGTLRKYEFPKHVEDALKRQRSSEKRSFSIIITSVVWWEVARWFNENGDMSLDIFDRVRHYQTELADPWTIKTKPRGSGGGGRRGRKTVEEESGDESTVATTKKSKSKGRSSSKAKAKVTTTPSKKPKKEESADEASEEEKPKKKKSRKSKSKKEESGSESDGDDDKKKKKEKKKSKKSKSKKEKGSDSDDDKDKEKSKKSKKSKKPKKEDSDEE